MDVLMESKAGARADVDLLLLSSAASSSAAAAGAAAGASAAAGACAEEEAGNLAASALRVSPPSAEYLSLINRNRT